MKSEVCIATMHHYRDTTG